MSLNARVNLVICQKSKIDDWVNHFRKYYKCHALDLTDATGMVAFWEYQKLCFSLPVIGIINYDLVWRRRELLQLENFTLLLDESSLIQNENSKRSSFILKLNPINVILLSGTPTGGKYELLWSQMHLLGWKISKSMYWNQFVNFHYEDVNGFPLQVIDGYKNEDRLKRKMRDHGCNFLKTEEVFDLPDQMHQVIRIQATKEYKKFRKDRAVIVENTELVGNTTLKKLLYERELCGQHNSEKLRTFKDLVQSTSDRLIVFYNFYAELDKMQEILMHEDFENHKRFSVVNGEIKALKNYEDREDSITFIQYQAGAMGLNLQKANRIIYFTPPLSAELWMQSQKRIHRIGQRKTCFYYKLVCEHSIEESIYKTLEMRRDYTEKLFENEYY